MREMTSMNIKPAVLRWAAERAGHGNALLAEHFPGVSDWNREEMVLEVGQLRKFAKRTHTSLGLLALSEPLDDSLPLTDFRTPGSRAAGRPKVDLLDTVWLCQMRQDWYRHHVQSQGQEALAFVGSAQVGKDCAEVARKMSDHLGFSVAQREDLDLDQAFRNLADLIENSGILVMVNGCVGSDTSRILDTEQLRGFAIPDRWAPLIFINGTDSSSARMFTLAHELAHIWLGSAAISNLAPQQAAAGPETEKWCNAVAGELLVPEPELRQACRELADVENERAVMKLRRRFRVSATAILIRLRAIGKIAPEWCDRQISGINAREGQVAGGGNLHSIAINRASPLFARAILVEVFEGRMLITEAMNLLNVKQFSVLEEMLRQLTG